MNLIRRSAFALLLLMIVAMGCESPEENRQGWTPAILSEEIQTENYLPDFSYAGYHWGEEDLPDLAPTMNVTDFGAIPDDGIEDTEAFRKALAAATHVDGRVVLKIPAGRFIIRDILYLERGDFVLQGAGSDDTGTVLYFPIPLERMPFPPELAELQEYLIEGNKRVKTGELFSPFAWMGGLIWPHIRAKRSYPYLSKYDSDYETVASASFGKRGEHDIVLQSGSSVQAGEILRINWHNPSNRDSSFVRHLYESDDVPIGARHWENPQRPLVTQDVTITGIAGDTIIVKQPLLHDLRPEWRVRLSREPFLSEVGIEHLRIEFPETEYGGHHLEAGFNAIYLTDLIHAWVRDVKIHNADNAILSDNCANVTIQDIEVSGRKAHYGCHLGMVYNMLVKNFVVACSSEHSISFNTLCKGSVYTNGLITATPSLDQHCGANHQNLFDNIRITELRREFHLFMHGGAGYWQPTHGAFNTFWNIQLEFGFENLENKPIEIVGISDGPHARFVGFHANYPLSFEYGPDAYIEGMNKPDLAVPSLYDYQLTKRQIQNCSFRERFWGVRLCSYL